MIIKVIKSQDYFFLYVTEMYIMEIDYPQESYYPYTNILEKALLFGLRKQYASRKASLTLNKPY